MATIQLWEMTAPREPFVRATRQVSPGAGEALIRIAGCGVCHTDLGFFEGAVRTHHALPLALGHEVSGVVEEAGAGAEGWIGRAVVVPAVLPCGECPACRKGRAALCPKQVFPGNDVSGGFASHLLVPARFLCPAGEVTAEALPLLSVIADAVSTPYEAVRRSGLSEGDVALFVGVGGVGGFGVQIAKARGATVIAIDPDAERRELALAHGAALALDPTVQEPSLRDRLKAFIKENRLPAEEWKVFETSGTPAGQTTAMGLLPRGGHLAVVGFTPEKVTIHLSRLMAMDARAEGNWGCPPDRYPEILQLVHSGKVLLEPYVTLRPMSEINAVFQEMKEHRLHARAVLIPDFF